MKERINNYKAYIDTLLKEHSPSTDWEMVRTEHLRQLDFFMHERLIHLIVTVLFALMEISVLTIIISNFSIGVLVLFLLIMVLLVPYVMHYYLLENSVQYMYEQYDRINELAGILAFKNR